MTPIFPKSWIDRFVDEHPTEAFCICLCGLVLALVVLYLVLDP